MSLSNPLKSETETLVADSIEDQTPKTPTPEEFVHQLRRLDASDAARLIESEDSEAPVEVVAAALKIMGSQSANSILELLSETTQEQVREALPGEVHLQWELNESFPDGSIGRLMDPTLAVFKPETTVQHTVNVLRELVKREFVTYGYVIDSKRHLIGVIVMRDLLFADPANPLSEIMISDPFSLKASRQLMEGMREVLTKHYPVYPVINDQEEFVGVVRGHRLFEAQAIEISAQAGSMVGVEKEEKLTTPWSRSFKSRHPWLQLNLLTAFVAGGVVSVFQGTIDQIVVLAAFLPVLAGQSGNTGCQALAVTIRGLTLGQLQKGDVKRLIFKEGFLGLINGTLVGISAGLGMYFLASSQGNELAFALSAIVFVAMIGSCCISGVSGAIIPLALRRIGADPATASSIFLTTATDVASMGILLSLASYFLL